MGAVNLASADIAGGIDIDFVTIGNAGNAGDTRAEAYPSGCGAVAYNYRIGKYEVTAAQWQTINAAAGIGDPGGWSGDQPVARISWYEAAQFCNYLTSGNKSLGAYQLGPGGSITVDRDAAMSTYGMIYVLPTEDEWYKAAYYKPDGSGYSSYANGEESIPPADYGWNYYGGAYSTPWNVGTGTQEQNGTFDMMGNVWEWNERVFDTIPNTGFRGGSYAIQYYYTLRPGWPENVSLSSADNAGGIQAWREETYVGFRVASECPPLPSHDPWSFVHMTDTHIGFMVGHVDPAGDYYVYKAEDRLCEAISQINGSSD
jgi:formylglycine-generating enzyme required for sulfatase activity